MVADLQHKPLLENLLEDRTALVKRGFVRPHSRQPGNLAKTGAVFEGLELRPFHRLVDVAGQHRLNDTRNPPSTPNLQRPRPLGRMEKTLTVGVAQLVERWIVVPVVVGSNPTTHPKPTAAGTFSMILAST